MTPKQTKLHNLKVLFTETFIVFNDMNFYTKKLSIYCLGILKLKRRPTRMNRPVARCLNYILTQTSLWVSESVREQCDRLQNWQNEHCQLATSSALNHGPTVTNRRTVWCPHSQHSQHSLSLTVIDGSGRNCRPCSVWDYLLTGHVTQPKLNQFYLLCLVCDFTFRTISELK